MRQALTEVWLTHDRGRQEGPARGSDVLPTIRSPARGHGLALRRRGAGRRAAVPRWLFLFAEDIPTLICFRADYAPAFKDKILAGLRDLHLSPAGQQVLTVFRCEKLEEIPADGLQSTLDLLGHFENLREGVGVDPINRWQHRPARWRRAGHEDVANCRSKRKKPFLSV